MPDFRAPIPPAPPLSFAFRRPSQSLAFYTHFGDPLLPPDSPAALLSCIFDAGLELGPLVVMEWYGGWGPLGQPLAIITFLSIIQLHDVVVRYRLRMLALGAPFLCAQHPDRLYTGRGVDFTPFDRPLPLTIRLVVDARRLALAHGVAVTIVLG
jgi:hypothetical protein